MCFLGSNFWNEMLEQIGFLALCKVCSKWFQSCVSPKRKMKFSQDKHGARKFPS